MTTIREEMTEDNWQEGGGSAGVEDMRRALLFIGCSDSDLRSRIASGWSDGWVFESVEGGNRSDSRVSQSRPGDGTTFAIMAPPLTRPLRTWEHGNFHSMNPADRTFDLVIDKGALD